MKKAWYLLLFGLLFVIGIGSLSGVPGQDPPDQEEVWRAFVAWFRTAAPEADPTRGYLLKLQKQSVPGAEIERQAGIIKSLFFSRLEAVEIYYDRAFARPLTGNPARDGFNSSPSAFLVEAVKEVKPGTALDAGMGQGRNAVYLAQKDWHVTGFDISKEALAAARSNAEKAGVTIATVKASYDTFDFGAGKWDLIVLTFAWAPVADPGFVARLGTSLRRGGKIVFEHFLDTPERPQPPGVRALKPGQLRTIFSDYAVESYEETEGMGDWGGPGSRLVRMLARKR